MKVYVEVVVCNNGDRDGSEVVQLYVSDKESSMPRPEKELKSFAKAAPKGGRMQKGYLDARSA